MGKIRLTGATSGYTEIQAASAAGNNTIILPTTNGGQVIVSDSSGNVNIDSGTFYVDASNNRVGIGTTSPGADLHITGGSATIRLGITTSNQYGEIYRDTSTGALAYNSAQASPFCGHIFLTSGTERARIDSSGRLLVGTSSSRAFYTGNYSSQLQIEGSGSGAGRGSLSVINNAVGSNPVFIALGKSNTNSIGGTTLVANGEWLGNIAFQGTDGTNMVPAAYIDCYVDGAPGANDMPGRLVFSTTADGASSPTERMRISNNGTVLMQKTAAGIANEGLEFIWGLGLGVTNNQNPVLRLNRLGTDGTVVSIQQDSVEEGTISVSGTTVSYNGAHLSRWSQLPGGVERIEILRGTVLSNTDEMCAWGDEDNEQLNRMKVSDVEGDPNVSGVFQAWDDDDDTYTDDFYCAMTGDFIIRIAEGVTVQRGDLLMSAGDGTAKPQDDDIIRSKTVAKVTSTHVTCTYDDGSYCVPCVLMAC
jgi:hypothetical protein